MTHGPLGFVGFIALILLLAVAGSRLLGVRLSLSRAVATGFIGLVAGFVVGFLVDRRNPGQITPLVLLTAVIATTLLTVLAELFVRPGERARGAGPFGPWRRLRWTAQSSRRYGQLARIAARHGLAGFFRGRSAEPAGTSQLAIRLRLTLEEAGPIFVKLGQAASTRTDLLPTAITEELSRLQDHVPPAPWPQIEALLESELGAPVSEVFANIEKDPIASASVAQAHAAQLRDGQPVILKVQRPGIAESVDRDLEIIRRVTRRLESRTEWARAYQVAELGRGFADALAEELDFEVEARNIAAIAASAPPQATVLVPTVHTETSSRRLLVLDRFDGVAVREAGSLLSENRADREGLARELLGCLLNQIFVQGTFHADPHPGNVMVLRTGQLALIDFGSVGRLDVRQQAALRRLMVAISQREPGELYEAVIDLASSSAHDEERLERTLAAFMARHLGPGGSPDAGLVRDLLTILTSAGLAFPPVIAGVFRAFVTLDGTLRTLAPGFDMVAHAQELAKELAGEQFTPRSVRDAATSELVTLLPMLRRLPRRADQISAALARGRLTINVRWFSDANDVHVITGLVNRAVLGMVGAAVGVISVIMLVSHAGPQAVRGVTLLQLFGYVGLFISITLMLRVVVEVLRHRP